VATSAVFHDAVRPWEDQRLASVGKPNQVGRSSSVASHLDDLTELIWVADIATVDVESVADLGLHRTTSVRPG
jgi:hypothetical protein